MNNKKNNKGFSLVELIVVIAVMAILVGVLAPAYLRYVDKAKLQKDVSAVGEVVEAIKIAAAEEAVAEEISTDRANATVISIETDGEIAVKNGGADILKEIQATVGEKVNFSSSALSKVEVTMAVYRDIADYNLVIDVSGTGLTADNNADVIDDLNALDENVPAPASGKQNS